MQLPPPEGALQHRALAAHLPAWALRQPVHHLALEVAPVLQQALASAIKGLGKTPIGSKAKKRPWGQKKSNNAIGTGTSKVKQAKARKEASRSKNRAVLIQEKLWFSEELGCQCSSRESRLGFPRRSPGRSGDRRRGRGPCRAGRHATFPRRTPTDPRGTARHPGSCSLTCPKEGGKKKTTPA